jgi:hypothetical protein
LVAEVLKSLGVIGGELSAGWARLFGRAPSIGDADKLADFIDTQSAFLVQKGIYEYSRARAGHYSKVLFKEQPFIDAVERARWSAYPLGLAMVGELVEGILRPHAGAARNRQLEAIRALVLSVFDRYPSPSAVGAQAWRKARGELADRLQQVGLKPAKRAFEIADPFLKAYFDLLPINAALRKSELPTIHGYLRVTLCNVHNELTTRMDAPALVASLIAQPCGTRDACDPGS